MTQRATTLPHFESSPPARTEGTPPNSRAARASQRDHVVARAYASLFWAAFVLLTFAASRITA